MLSTIFTIPLGCPEPLGGSDRRVEEEGKPLALAICRRRN
jgi:hypothetical protein